MRPRGPAADCDPNRLLDGLSIGQERTREELPQRSQIDLKRRAARFALLPVAPVHTCRIGPNQSRAVSRKFLRIGWRLPPAGHSAAKTSYLVDGAKKPLRRGPLHVQKLSPIPLYPGGPLYRGTGNKD